MKQASLDRGSFASLLGVCFYDHGNIQVIAIGDSLAVLCDGDDIVATHPYIAPDQFLQAPQLLSTNSAENAFLSKIDWDEELYRDWRFQGLSHPALLCMTDALGQWVLTLRDQGAAPITILRQIAKPKQFAELVRLERKAGRLRRDDTTLLAFW
jgi:hypothetical protein